MSFVFMEDYPLIGPHIGKRSSLKETVELAMSLPVNCAQMYISSSRSYNCPLPEIKDMLATRKILRRYSFKVFVHACLLYNLYGCTSLKNPNYSRNLELTKKGLKKELDICVCCNFVGAVVHIGSAEIREKGIPRIAQTITECLIEKGDYTRVISESLGTTVQKIISSRVIILENSAGEGNTLGRTISEIAEIIENVDESVRNQVKVCIDTAHIFGAGAYNLREKEGVVNMLEDICRYLKDRLILFHLNDSEVEFGTRRDSHMNLFRGHIFAEHLHFIEKIKTKRWYSLSIGKKGIENLFLLIDYANRNGVSMIVESPSSSIPDIIIVKEIHTSFKEKGEVMISTLLS